MKSTMKKFASLMMALIMLLSCSAAFAETPAANMTQVHQSAVSGNNNFAKEGTTVASQSTDVWLQVEASGQIDVTIPLVAVFHTNINGGSAKISDTYKMVNNSTSAIKITNVTVEDKQVSYSPDGDETHLTLVQSLTGAYDEYMLTVKPTDHYTTQVWDRAVNVADASFATKENGSYKFSKEGTKKYSISSGENAEDEGLWRIEKKNTSNTDESYIELNLQTSKLSFVTKKDGTDNKKYGVKMFNIAYTVKIDDSTAIGDTILTGDLTAPTSSATSPAPIPAQ